MRKKMKEAKGITLASLVITIIVLTILASIAVYNGENVIENSKVTKFIAEMKIMQTKVNEYYQEYKDKGTVNILGKEYNKDEELSTETEQASTCGIYNKKGYIYLSEDNIKNDLKIEGVESTYFINIANRHVVSYNGVVYQKTMYYTLDGLPKELYNVEYNWTTDTPTFECSIEESEAGKWKIRVSNITYSKNDINKWVVKYAYIEKSQYADAADIPKADIELTNTTKDVNFDVNKAGYYVIGIESIDGAVKSDQRRVVEATK